MKTTVLKQIEGKNVLKDDLNYPTPKIRNDNEVLIKIVATAVNPIDYQIFSNKNEARAITSNILGRELSGIIVEKGSNVTEYQIGDEVYTAILSMGSNGSFAEFVVVPTTIIAPKPQKLTFEQAASLPVSYITAWQIFSRLEANKNKSMIILGGTTSVGKALINILIKNNYDTLFTTSGNEESFKQLVTLKVKPENILSYHNKNFIQNVFDSNNDKPFEIVVDCIGNAMSEIAGELIVREGIYVDVTNLRTNIANNLLFRKASNIMNISRYETPDLFYKYSETLKKISTFVTENNYSPEILNIDKLNAENIYKSFELIEKNLTKSKKLF